MKPQSPRNDPDASGTGRLCIRSPSSPARLRPAAAQSIRWAGWRLDGDGAYGGRGYAPRVFRHDAAGVAGFGRLPGGEPLGELDVTQLDVESAVRDVEHHDVAVSQGGDRAAHRGLRRDVAGHE